MVSCGVMVWCGSLVVTPREKSSIECAVNLSYSANFFRNNEWRHLFGSPAGQKKWPGRPTRQKFCDPGHRFSGHFFRDPGHGPGFFDPGHIPTPFGYLTKNFEILLGLATSTVDYLIRSLFSFCFCVVLFIYILWLFRKLLLFCLFRNENCFNKSDLNIPTLSSNSCLVSCLLVF